MAVSIFEYTDFRQFLRERYDEIKSERKIWSHRFVAQKVGFKSSGHFSLLLSGSLRLGNQFLGPLCQLFGIHAQERHYFELLVNYNQAKTEQQRQFFEKEIAGFGKNDQPVVEYEQYEFYRDWYNAAIREIIASHPIEVKDAVVYIRSKVRPQISASKIQKSLNLLLSIQMIHTKDGYYHVNCESISTGNNKRDLFLDTYVQNFCLLAAQSPFEFKRGEKSNSWLAFSASQETFETVVSEIRECRKRILNMVQGDKNQGKVYHLNFNLFPLSNEL